MGVRESRDVEAAVRYLRDKRRMQHVAVIGCSQGGASVILAAAEDPEIEAIVKRLPDRPLWVRAFGCAAARLRS